MNKNFSLLLLYDKIMDKHPRSWICFNVKGIKNFVLNLEKRILRNKSFTRESLSRHIASKLNCSYGIMKSLFQGKRKYYPIPFLLYLSKMGKQPLRLGKIISLKVNSASSKPIKIPIKLNRNLAKIVGAFMADGSLTLQILFSSTKEKDLNLLSKQLKKLKIKFSKNYIPSRKEFHIGIIANKDILKILKTKIYPCVGKLNIQTNYSLELADEHRDNVESFGRWISQEFAIDSFVHKRKNAWRIYYQNKVLARFLIEFFDISPGPKTYVAFEPKVIKSSNLDIRREFVKGLLMFDGHISVFGDMSFTTVSKNLFNSVKAVWSLDSISFSYNNKGNGYELKARRSNNLDKIKKYFEKNTTKYKRLKWCSGELPYDPVPVKKHAKLTFDGLLREISSVKICDTIYLGRVFGCKPDTVRNYLRILIRLNRVSFSRSPKSIRLDTLGPKTTILLKPEIHDAIFNKVQKEYKTHYNFAQFIGLKKGTFSAMKVRKNRIPLFVLSEMIRLLDINEEEVLTNIEGLDREVVLIK